MRIQIAQKIALALFAGSIVPSVALAEPAGPEINFTSITSVNTITNQGKSYLEIIGNVAKSAGIATASVDLRLLQGTGVDFSINNCANLAQTMMSSPAGSLGLLVHGRYSANGAASSTTTYFVSPSDAQDEQSNFLLCNLSRESEK